jgi:hypothetical protein
MGSAPRSSESERIVKRIDKLLASAPTVSFTGKQAAWTDFRTMFKRVAKQYNVSEYLFGKTQPEEDEDIAAAASLLLFLHLQPNVRVQFREDQSAREVWSQLCEIYEGSSDQLISVRMKALNNYKCKPGTTMDDHLEQVTGLIAQVESCGHTISDFDKRDYLVGSLPDD